MPSRTTIQKALTILSRQVQWQHPMVVRGNIDQTQLSISGSGDRVAKDTSIKQSSSSEFSFVVMGDTDFGPAKESAPNRFAAMFAKQMTAQIDRSQFLLHTGDVTYPVGSYQNYLSGFLRPYRSLLSAEAFDGGDRTAANNLAFNQPIFNKPLLPVPGNHDYAQLPFWPRVRQAFVSFWLQVLSKTFQIKTKRLGGQGGRAYGQIFLDDLERLSPEELKHHLVQHYSAQPDNQTIEEPQTYCLNYVPGQFARLPNRYYTFSYQQIDFFALDSNTWSAADSEPGFDRQQLDWLEEKLVRSWRSPNSRGRVIYLHHSPYTTERSRWQQSDTLWVRRHLRQVLDNVKARLISESDLRLDDRPLVDLVLSGHAHCLEHVKTTQTGHADANIDWVVCGGSGLDIRRQRSSGTQIVESLRAGDRSIAKVVAQSLLYAGVHGEKGKNQRFHSFIRIDVPAGELQRLVVRPFVVVKGRSGWQIRALDKIAVGGFLKSRSSPKRPRRPREHSQEAYIHPSIVVSGRI